MRLNDAPDDCVVHRIIPMNDPVTKIDDPPQLRNPRSGGRITLLNASQRFADDFEFTLDCATKKRSAEYSLRVLQEVC